MAYEVNITKCKGPIRFEQGALDRATNFVADTMSYRDSVETAWNKEFPDITIIMNENSNQLYWEAVKSFIFKSEQDYTLFCLKWS